MTELKPRKMSEFIDAGKRVQELKAKGIAPERTFDLKLKPKNDLTYFGNELNPAKFAEQHEQILKSKCPQDEIQRLRKKYQV